MKTSLALLALALFAGGGQAKVVEEQFDLPVQITNAYGKRIEQPIKVTINHGRASEPADRAAMGRSRFADASRWFARLGFIAALPTRIGYGATGGEDVEDTGACNKRDYVPAYAAAAQQVVAALDAVRARPDARKDRSVVLGQSLKEQP